jgi:hypothetical protein
VASSSTGWKTGRIASAAQQRLDLGALVGQRRARGQVGRVAAGLAAAGVLGRVQGGVGVREQLGGLVRVAGERRDAGGGLEPAAADDHVADRGAGALGRIGGGLAADARQHEHELLAAEPADGVALADDRPQLGGGGCEHLVALGVAVGVVDALEVVEVDDHDAERAAGDGGGVDLAPQALLGAAVVEQPCEAVGGGLVAQVLALAGGLVGERGHGGEALDEGDLGVGAGDDGADVVEAHVREGAAVAHDPAGRPWSTERVSAMISSTHEPIANTGRRPVPSASTS